ncbi:MAG: hypothetical protein ACLRZG_05500 [Streptococcus sp.]
MTKIQRASIYLFLLLAGIGLEFELGHLSQQEFSQSAGRDLVLNLSVLAAIIIPLYLFSKRLAKQLTVPTLSLMDCHVWRSLRSRLVELFRQ